MKMKFELSSADIESAIKGYVAAIHGVNIKTVVLHAEVRTVGPRDEPSGYSISAVAEGEVPAAARPKFPVPEREADDTLSERRHGR